MNINLHAGKIVYNDFLIDFERSLDDQIMNLDEDLLQIKYGNDYLIDVGWYPCYDPEGELIIKVIESSDWENPLFKIQEKNINNFYQSLQSAIDFLQTFLKENPNHVVRKNPYLEE